MASFQDTLLQQAEASLADSIIRSNKSIENINKTSAQISIRLPEFDLDAVLVADEFVRRGQAETVDDSYKQATKLLEGPNSRQNQEALLRGHTVATEGSLRSEVEANLELVLAAPIEEKGLFEAQLNESMDRLEQFRQKPQKITSTVELPATQEVKPETKKYTSARTVMKTGADSLVKQALGIPTFTDDEPPELLNIDRQILASETTGDVKYIPASAVYSKKFLSGSAQDVFTRITEGTGPDVTGGGGTPRYKSDQIRIDPVSGEFLVPEPKFTRGMRKFGEFTMEHPYATSIAIDALATGIPSLRALGVARVAGVPLRAAAKKSLARFAKDFSLYGSLGVGAVFVAEEMRKNPENSKTHALLVEALGPAATILAFNLTWGGLVATLTTMSIRNQAKFAKLNQLISTADGKLANTLKDALKEAVSKQGEFKNLSTEQIVARITEGQPAPMARLVVNAATDPTVIRSQADLVEKALTGPASAYTQSVKRTMGLPDMEALVGVTAAPSRMRDIPVFTQLADVETFLKASPAGPETAALFRKQLEHIKSLAVTAETTKKIPAKVVESLNQAEKATKALVEGLDKKLIDTDLGDFLSTQYGSELLGNLPRLQQNLGATVMYETIAKKQGLPTVSIQGNVHTFLESNLHRTSEEIFEHSFKVEPGVWNVPGSNNFISNGFRKLGSGLLTPKAFFKENINDLVVRVQGQVYQKQRVRKELGHAWKMIQKPLSRSEKRELDNVLFMGDDAGETFKAVKGGIQDAAGTVHPMSDRARDAYFAARDLFDYTWTLGNEAGRVAAKGVGVRLLDEKTLIKIAEHVPAGTKLSNGVKFTNELKQSGAVVGRILDKETGNATKQILLTTDDLAERVVDIPKGFPLLDYHPGWMPIKYKGAWDVVAIKPGKGGTFFAQRVANAANKKSATNAIGDLLALEGEGSATQFMAVRAKVGTPKVIEKVRKGGGQIHKAPVREGQEVSEEWVSFLKTKATSDYIRNLPPEKIEELAVALEKMGMDQTALAGFIDESKHFSVYKNSFSRSRANVRKADARDLSKMAPRLNVDRSVGIYFDQLASTVSFTEMNIKLQDKFLKSFGQYLENKEDWLSKVKVLETSDLLGSKEGHKAFEAWMVQRQLKTIAGIKTTSEQAIDTFITNAANTLLDSRVAPLRTIGNQLEKLADTRGLVATFKGVTATAKFGFWALDQLLVQSTGALNILGKGLVQSPFETAKSAKQFQKYVLSRAVGRPIDEEAKFIMKMLDDSGYLAAVDYNALNDISQFKIPVLGAAIDASTVFFRWGETVNRGMSFLFELNTAMKLVRQGKHPIFKSVDDFETLAFRQHVAAKADMTSFNMSKVNQPLYAKGLLAIPFQFMQFFAHQAELMFGINAKFKGISRKDRLGIWTAWLGAFGLEGVPMAQDLAVFAEDIMAKQIQIGEFTLKEGQPEMVGRFTNYWPTQFADTIANGVKKLGLGEGDAEFWRRAVKSGLISALSEGQINISNRAGLSMVLNNFYDGFDWSDVAGAGGKIWYDVVHGLATSVPDLAIALRDPSNTDADVFLKSAQKIMKGFTAPRNAIRGLRAKESGDLVTPEGQMILEGLRLKEIVMLSVGLPDERLSLAYKQANLSRRQRQAWNNWSTLVFQGARDALNSGNIDHMNEILLDGLDQVNEWRPDLVPQYMRQSSRYILFNNGTSLEDQNRLWNIRTLKLNGDTLND